MAETSRSASRSALLRELGAELAEARLAAGLGVRQLARLANLTSHSRVSEQENGKTLLTTDELARVFDALKMPREERERLNGLVRSSKGPGQLNVGIPGINTTLAQLIDHEGRATRITDATLGLIPGLLQTSDYARAIMGDQPDSELRVTLRSGRRDILTRTPEPVELLALIDSEALVRPVASPRVIVEQLRHILHMAERPNITVQVVSSTVAGYHPLLAGSFELIEFAKATPIVLLDHQQSSVFLWDWDDVQRFVEDAELIRTKIAMTPARSAEVIAKIVQGMETT